MAAVMSRRNSSGQVAGPPNALLRPLRSSLSSCTHTLEVPVVSFGAPARIPEAPIRSLGAPARIPEVPVVSFGAPARIPEPAWSSDPDRTIGQWKERPPAREGSGAGEFVEGGFP
jgi:hypothetical protein